MADFHARQASKEEKRSWKAEFTVDEWNRIPLLKVCACFAQDLGALERFGMRPYHGVLLSGPPSVGKTHILKLLRLFRNEWGRDRSFGLKSAQSIMHDFETEGPASIQRTAKTMYNGRFMEFAFDDILSERRGRYYGGQEVDTTAELVNIRAELFDSHSLLTHFTTNYRRDRLEQEYGKRTTERILGMCDPVVFPAESTCHRY
ncbi:hypothetical protein [Rufibacter quisquiliarum]|uniref:ATPase AAA-type core domain-containing protein n=1 Tax=Rufibacter quisquiliarum TaxID=1549639 RepID=A0A839GDW8_9BACT|nr:hypothetical protein [Rufibacter quisquiliarum]MBA9077112.1 hypothetical protein [Rufibacter quisquiliarum]